MENENLEKVIKNIYDSLTDEQKEKAKACNTVDDFTKFAAQEGIELPDELLESVSGGAEIAQTIYSMEKKEPKTTPYQVTKKSSLFGWC